MHKEKRAVEQEKYHSTALFTAILFFQFCPLQSQKSFCQIQCL